MTSLRFQIGGVDEEFVRIEVIASNGDGWLPSHITIRTGGFHGNFSADLDSWGFARFATELKSLYADLKRSATFTTYERQLELTIVGDGIGHMRLHGEAMDYAGTGNKLIFQRSCVTWMQLSAPIRRVRPDHGLERTAKCLSEPAAGAWTSIAPAARWTGGVWPAQRGRWAEQTTAC